MINKHEMKQSLDTEKKEEIVGMTAFLGRPTDSYAILQLKDMDELADEFFVSFSNLQRRGKKPDITHYNVVYTDLLPPYSDQDVMLEDLYTKFNIDRPKDFRGHSMSVSDIVALKIADKISFHYVDSFGFKELQGFMKSKNQLEHEAADTMENCSTADGNINKEIKRPSVLGKLKEMSVSDTPRKLSRSCPERDIE